jgi:hypothetical protein
MATIEYLGTGPFLVWPKLSAPKIPWCQLFGCWEVITPNSLGRRPTKWLTIQLPFTCHSEPVEESNAAGMEGCWGDLVFAIHRIALSLFLLQEPCMSSSLQDILPDQDACGVRFLDRLGMTGK